MDKENKDQLNEIETKSASIPEKPEEKEKLKTSKPVNTTPPSESAKEYGKKVGDYEDVVTAAGKNGVDLNKVGEMPLMDSDKQKITESVKGMYGKQFANGLQNLSNSITAPQNEEANRINQQALLKEQRRIRRARLGDALTAFGEGLQGKSVDSENFLSNKLERKRDKQFQDYRDVTERNKRTKYLFENQTRKELVDWAEEQAKNESLNERERRKFQMLSDQFKENLGIKKDDIKIKKEKNAIDWAKLEQEKDKKDVKVQTAQQTYKLKPEEAAFYKGEILKNADTLRKKYPGWFTETQKTDPLTGAPVGGVTYKLNPQVEDTDMIRAYLEDKEPGHLNENAYEQNKSSYFEKYRKQKGLSTEPASQVTKPNTTTPQKQAVKKDPLGLGI